MEYTYPSKREREMRREMRRTLGEQNGKYAFQAGRTFVRVKRIIFGADMPALEI